MTDNPATQPPTPGSPETASGASSKPRSKAAEQLLRFLNDNFSNVFSSTHWVYTLCFFTMALFIAVLRFVPGSLLLALYVATSLVFNFFLLFVFSSHDAMAPLVLKGTGMKKLLVFAIFFGISIGITALAFYASKGFPIQYQFDTMLPVVYMLIFFGWNFIQIFFIKKGFEDISAKVEQKIFKEETSLEGKKDKGIAFLLLGIAAPAGMLVGVIALLFYDADSAGYLLWNHPIGQVIFIGWMAGMVILLGASSFNALVLYKQTVKHETPSVFSSFIHMLFLVYILFRSYQFINGMGKAIQNLYQEMPWADNLLDAIIMVLTLLLLFKGLGSKLSRASFFNKSNLPFITFLFSTAVIMGNMVLILGIQVSGSTVQLPQPLVSAINGFIMMAVSMAYYFLHVKRALMARNQLEKDTYSMHEIQSLFLEFTDTIAGRYTMEKAGLHSEMERFLLAHEIEVPTYTPPAPSSPRTSGAPETSTVAAQPRKAGKAGFFDGVDKPAPTQQPATPVDEKPVASKYPLEQPKKLDDDRDSK